MVVSAIDLALALVTAEGDAPRPSWREEAPLDEADLEMLRDLEMFILFELLRDFDLFADEADEEEGE